MTGDAPTVLRLVTRLNVGGPARHVMVLTKGLAPRYSTVLAAGTPAPEEGELLDPDVPLVRLPLVRPVSPGQDVAALLATRRLLTRHHPAIVHTHMAKAGTIGRLAARSLPRRPRTIHTYHGHVLDGYFKGPVQRAFIEAERLLARTTDVLVSVSEQTRDELLDLRIGRPAQHVVVPLGLPLDAHLAVTGPSGHLRRHLGLGPAVPLIGIVGRLVPIKDVPVAVDAVRQVPGAHLAILGDGESRAEVEDAVRRAGLADRVHFVGWWQDVAAAMSDLDVVVLTSRNEGTPVALIEASACRRPVVATDVGGVRTVVVDGLTGFLHQPGDATGLAGSLARILADPTLAAALGAAGRNHVADRFAADRLVHDIGALYDELLGR